MKKNYINDGNSTIQIVCEDKILELLKKEFIEYYNFYNEEKEIVFTLYIYINKQKYDMVSKKVKNKMIKQDRVCIKDREGIIMLDKKKKEIVLLYQELNNNNVQLIGEIIISLFGILMEQKGYFYVHSSCVEKDKKGIAIIGARKAGKTTLLNTLLQNKFNFVCNSHLGIKSEKNEIVAWGAPSRMGMRVETLCNVIQPSIRDKIMKYSEIKQRFGEDIENNLEAYQNKKFNIKINEIKDIYNVELRNNTTVKIFIIPVYMPGIKHIEIKKISNAEFMEVLLKNRRRGVYNTVKYIDNIFFSEQTNMICKLKNINAYMIYQNEKNGEEVIKFINSKL